MIMPENYGKNTNFNLKNDRLQVRVGLDLFCFILSSSPLTVDVICSIFYYFKVASKTAKLE